MSDKHNGFVNPGPYTKMIGEPKSKEVKIKQHIVITGTAYKFLMKQSKLKCIKVSDVIRLALAEYMEKENARSQITH